MKYLASLLIALSALIAVPSSAYAQELCPPGFDTLCQIKLENSGGIVADIIVVILVIAVIVCLFFLVWGGIRWIMSEGDKAKVAQARSTIIAALVGLGIAFFAFFIVNVVYYVFTGEGITDINVPKLVK